MCTISTRRGARADCDGSISTQRSAHGVPVTVSSLSWYSTKDVSTLRDCSGSSSDSISDIEFCHIGWSLFR